MPGTTWLGEVKIILKELHTKDTDLEIENMTKTKWKEIITKSVAKPAADGTNKLSTECSCNLFRNKNRLNHYLRLLC